MTPLRKQMLEELCRHNYAPGTQQSYVAQIAKLARHFGTSPDQLTREQVQQYQDLLTSQQVSWLPQAVAAMQFLFNKTLDRNWTIAATPCGPRDGSSPRQWSENVRRCAATSRLSRSLKAAIFANG